MPQMLRNLWSQERGEGLVEYALIILLVSLVLIAGMKELSSKVNRPYTKASSQVTASGGMDSIHTGAMGNDHQKHPPLTAQTR